MTEATYPIKNAATSTASSMSDLPSIADALIEAMIDSQTFSPQIKINMPQATKFEIAVSQSNHDRSVSPLPQKTPITATNIIDNVAK